MDLYIDDKKIKKKDIIGIFDIDDKTTPEATKNFLRHAEKQGETEIVGYDLPKSFILTDTKKKTGEEGEKKVIFSQLSAKILAARAEETIIDTLI